ncbi:MAG: hypothetical protein Q8R40_05085 [bacterium]|nr:hypothetical protein [bacterium]
MEKQVTMAQYVLFVNCTAGDKPREINWAELAKEYGFSIDREFSTHCRVNADGRTLARLTADHPEIQVTSITSYHQA